MKTIKRDTNFFRLLVAVVAFICSLEVGFGQVPTQSPLVPGAPSVSPTPGPTSIYGICTDAFECTESSFSVTGSSNIECQGYFGCYNSSLLSLLGDGDINCYGSHSCYKATTIEINNATHGGYIFCNGLKSCANVGTITSNDEVNHDITCLGEQSCSSSKLIGNTVRCSGERSCENSIIQVTSEVYLDGHLSGANSKLYAGDTDTSFYFQGSQSGYNATVFCNKTCSIYCDGNGCNDLTINCLDSTNSCNLNIDCLSAELSDICTDGHSVSEYFDMSALPSTRGKGFSTTDNSIVACNNGTNCDSYGQCISSQYTADASMCCTAYFGCISLTTIESNKTDSNNFDSAIRCDGEQSCSVSSKIRASKGANIYMTGHFAVAGTTNTILSTTPQADIYCNGQLSCYTVSITTSNNTYCFGSYGCAYSVISSVGSIWVYGSYGGQYSTMSSITGNVYCLSYHGCTNADISNIGGTVYAFGFQTLSYSIVKKVSQAVYAIGYYVLIGATVNDTDTAYCIGNHACYSATLNEIGTFYANGTNVLNNATIISGYNREIYNFTIYGSMSAKYSMYCNVTAYCQINCGTSEACNNMLLYCDGDCLVYCNSDAECPILKRGNYTRISVTSAPSAPPTPSPTTSLTYVWDRTKKYGSCSWATGTNDLAFPFREGVCHYMGLDSTPYSFVLDCDESKFYYFLNSDCSGTAIIYVDTEYKNCTTIDTCNTVLLNAKDFNNTDCTPDKTPITDWAVSFYLPEGSVCANRTQFKVNSTHYIATVYTQDHCNGFNGGSDSITPACYQNGNNESEIINMTSYNSQVTIVIPTISPTKNPTVKPTSKPTPKPTTKVTLTPTQSPTVNYEFIESDDLTFDDIASNTYTKGYFNPGYSNTLESNIQIRLNSEGKVNLFEAYLNDEEDIDLTITLTWTVYDVTTEGSETTVSFGSDVKLTKYRDEDIDTYNYTYGLFDIDSFYVIYSGSSTSRSSGLSLCNAVDNTYFTADSIYKFENTITISWYDNRYDESYSLSKNTSFTSIANAAPSGGTCDVDPNKGTALVDAFNFTCKGWSDSSGSTVKYNFVKDDSNTFLNTYYSTIGEASGYFSSGVHNITAIIIDNLDLAYCETLTIYVDNNLTSLSDSTENFTDFITSTVNSLLDDIVTNTSDDSVLGTAMSVLEAAYSLSVVYLELNTNETTDDASVTDEEEALALLQETIIAKTISISNELVLDTVDEAVTFLSTLAEITQPIITIEEFENSDDSGQNRQVYSESTITDSLLANENIVYALSLSVNESSSLSSDTAQDVITLISNIQEMRRVSNEDNTTAKESGARMVNSTTAVMSLLLQNNVVGEEYIFESNAFSVKAAKISESDYSACSNTTNGGATVQLSPELVSRRSNDGENKMDCTLLTSSDNVYGVASENSENGTQFQSDFFLVNVDTAGALSRRRTQRRMRRRRSRSLLADGDMGSAYLSTCEPIILTFNTTNASYWDNNFPTCSFYNETTERYESDGCYVVASQGTNVICACLHLTYFGVSSEEFVPTINYVEDDFIYADITLDNLLVFNIGWVFTITWISFAIVLGLTFEYNHKNECHCCSNKCCCGNILDSKFCKCCTCHRIEDVPLILQHTALFVSNDDIEKEERMKYRIIKEARLIKDDFLKHRSYIVKLWHLFRIALRNDHIWWGICCRNNGSSFNHSQRIAVMMIRLLTTMAVSALFYGVSKDSVIGDLSLTFYESLIGFIPVFIIQKTIKERKPLPHEIDRFKNEFEEKLKPLTSVTSTSATNHGTGTGGITSPLHEEITNTLAFTDVISSEHRKKRESELKKLKRESKKQKKSGKKSKVKRVATTKLLEILADDDEIAGYGKNGTLRHGMIVTQKTTSIGENGENDIEMVSPASAANANATSGIEMDGDNNEQLTGSPPKAVQIDDNEDEDDDNDDAPEVSASESASESGSKTKNKNDGNVEVITAKLSVFNEIRHRLVHRTFVFPAWFRYLNMCLILIWTLACAIITTLWCLWFDVVLDASNGYANDIISNCTNEYAGYDVSEKTFLNYNLTKEWLDSINGTYVSVYEPPTNDSFGDDFTVSQRFFIATLMSYCLGIFFWQPIILLLKSIFKLRSIENNPELLNEAMLFYDPKHLVNLDELAKLAAMNATTKDNDNNGDTDLLGDDFDSAYGNGKNNNKNKMKVVNTEDIEDRAP